MTDTRYHLTDASRRSRWPSPREWIAGVAAGASAIAAAILAGQPWSVAACFGLGAGCAVVGGMKGRTP